ncbi:MAG: CobQ/CobB/MinD/ParA nucleotide binding protein [Planctomycetota bacterium]|nr:CobQ/CobB/MinD/ParA nucleotide binding protein [Planctomycetota bacterium]
MRDIDQALAKAYGARTPVSRAAPDTPPVLPRPHFPIESPPDSEPSFGVAQAPLNWPETVRALERAHGERFDRLSDALIEARDRQNLKVLLFTSCHRAEGRTTLVLTLARALARRPGRTLLVDGDLSGPMLARQLGLSPRIGLDDVVEHGQAVVDALIEAPDDHLTILPLRAAVSRPRDFLASPEWSCLMARLRRDYDLVLIDGSPLFTGLSAAVLHRSVDAAILVHHKARTTNRALTRAREVLDAGGVPLLGLAETFC